MDGAESESRPPPRGDGISLHAIDAPIASEPHEELIIKNMNRCARVPCAMWGRRRTWRNPSAAGGASALTQPALAAASARACASMVPRVIIFPIIAAWAWSPNRPNRPSVRWALRAGRGGSRERMGSSRRLGGGHRTGAEAVDDWQDETAVHPTRNARRAAGLSVGRQLPVEPAQRAGESPRLPVPPPGDTPPTRLKPIYPHPRNRVRRWRSGEFGGVPKGHSRAARGRAESGVAANRCAADSADTKGVRSGVCR